MKINRIEEYLELLFPNPKCELIYDKDYELLIAIVLSAQSTDKRVYNVTPILFKKYPTLKALKDADLADIEDIIRPVGSFRNKADYIKNIACILVNDYNEIVPINRDDLIRFSRVGRKTINVFLSEFYNIPAIAVDTHVERVSKRLKLALKNDGCIDYRKKIRKAGEDIYS